jgi:S-formylglutathione hydrolase FrmB
MKKLIRLNLSLIFIFAFIFSAFAQEQTQSGKVENFKLNSKLMSREMPYRVIFPVKYDQKDNQTRYSVLYLLHGLTGHFDNWSDKTKLAEYASKYKYIIVMPEGNDGWYSDSVSVPNDKHESYFIQELIPEIDAKFRTVGTKESRAIAGLSMGGYGALKFGLKYPEKFVLAGSFSGALDAPLRGQNHQFLRPSIMSVFGEEGNKSRKDNDIFSLINLITPEKIKDLPFLYIDCGTEDWLIEPNRDFATFLFQKKIPHEFRQLPGKHDWKFWDSEVDEFLEVADKFVK